MGLRQAVRVVAIALNAIATLIICWTLWTVLSPIVFEGDNALLSISANLWVVAAGLAPISALIALLWGEGAKRRNHFTPASV
jgi:hypothetical protein